MKTIIYPKQNNKTEFFGPWTGLSQGTEKQLEDIGDYAYGAGKLGIVGKNLTLTNIIGATATPLVEGTHFAYGKRLDASTTEDPTDGFGTTAGGIIDTGTSGALAAGKAIRLVDAASGSALNIKNAGGLNLKVYAKDLSAETPPPSDRIYVNPLTGKFFLPRPIYWSEFYGGSSISNPKIGGTLTPTGSAYSASTTGGKFNKGYVRWYSTTSYASGVFQQYYPLGNYLLPDKGALSFWFMANTSYSYWDIDTNQFRYRSQGYASSSALFASTTIQGSDIVNGAWMHIMITWNRTTAFSDGKKIKVYVNGTLDISATELRAKNDTLFLRMFGEDSQDINNTSAYVCNLKIWDEPIEEAAWEYNAGAGREDALHPIYGATNGYKPKLIAPGGGGYLYIPEATAAAALSRPSGANAPVTLEAVSDYSNGVGYFGTGHKIYDTDYTSLSENVDYYLDEAWDGTGTHAIDKYDDGVSGSLGTGKIIRVVNDIGGVAKNLTDPTGLNLKPVVKNMITDNYTPPATEFWVDPTRGKVILPRPNYINKYTGLSPITSIIQQQGFTPEVEESFTGVGNRTVVAGNIYPNSIWSNAGSGYGSGDAMFKEFPFGKTHTFTKGTVSFWTNIYSDYSGSLAQTLIGFGDVMMVSLYTDGNNASNFNAIYINGGLVTSVPGIRGAWTHYYVIWDTAKTLTGGKSVRVFRNGAEILSTTNSINTLPSGFYIYTRAVTTTGIAGTSNVSVEGLKIYKDVALEDPSWDYNGGVGRPDALHPIYGTVNGYKPKLSGVGGVGYYKAGGTGSLVRGKI